MNTNELNGEQNGIGQSKSKSVYAEDVAEQCALFGETKSKSGQIWHSDFPFPFMTC